MDCTGDAPECSLLRKRWPTLATTWHLLKDPLPDALEGVSDALHRRPKNVCMDKGRQSDPAGPNRGTAAPLRPARPEVKSPPPAGAVRLLDQVRHAVRT